MTGQTRQRLAFSLPLDPARLLRARHRVADFLERQGAGRRITAELVLAVDEAVTNAIRHSGSAEDLTVELERSGRDVRVRVVDSGCGFDAGSFDPRQTPDPLGNRGRGLFLMARVTDELELISGPGTEVFMVKKGALQPPAHASEAREFPRIEEAPEGFTTLDWDYIVTYANRPAAELYGFSGEGARGRSLWDVLPVLGRSPLRQRFEDAMMLGVPSICEYDSPSLGRWVELRIYPTSSGISVSINDIEARKRRELAREDDRRRAELLASTASRLLSTEDPQKAVDDLCRDVMGHLRCQVFFNYLVDQRAGGLVLNAYAGVSPEEASAIELLDFGVALCGCAALRAEPIVAEDIQRADDPRTGLVRSYGVQAYAAHPIMARGEVLGTLSFGTRERPRFSEEELAVMRAVTDHVAIALDRQRTSRELRRRQAEAAAQDERSRLARDLHDSVTQALFAASLRAEALSLGERDIPPEVAGAIEQVRRLNRGALAQMRTMLLELRDEPLESVPLLQLLRNLVEATESRSNVDAVLTVAGDVPLPRPLHLAVYRITQEALNNVVRHAQAPHAWVNLELEQGAGRLIVRDDGRGFDPSAVGPTHLGISSMRERAAGAGAAFSVESGPGGGTTATMWWPSVELQASG